MACALLGSKLEENVKKITDKKGSIILRLESSDDGVLFDFASGTLNETTTESVTIDTKFEIGHITKSFVASIYSDYFSKGTYQPTTPISDILQDDVLKQDPYKNNSNITLGLLLKHYGGLHDHPFDLQKPISQHFIDYNITPPENSPLYDQFKSMPTGIGLFYNFHLRTFGHYPYETIIDPQLLIDDVISRMPLKSEPGTEFHYSDSGYVLLGKAIEVIEGKSLHEVLKSRFPALKDTFVRWEAPIDHINYGETSHRYGEEIFGKYSMTGPERYLTTFGFDWPVLGLSNDWASGGMLSTVSDLGGFIRDMHESDAANHKLQRESLYMNNKIDGYGYGIYCDDEDCEYVGHSGDGGSFMFYNTAMTFSVSGTTNTNSLSLDYLDLRSEIENCVTEKRISITNAPTMIMMPMMTTSPSSSYNQAMASQVTMMVALIVIYLCV